jgi:hypothetical protein
LRGNKIAENQEEIPGFRAEIAPVWALKTPDFAGFRRRNWLQKAIPAPAPAPACRNFRPPKRAEIDIFGAPKTGATSLDQWS